MTEQTMQVRAFDETMSDQKTTWEQNVAVDADSNAAADTVDAASTQTDDPLVNAAATAAADNGPRVAAPLAATQEENDKLRGERDQLFDRLARLQAEFENARKREARERTDYRAFAISDAVEQFLPVLDNFRLALTSGGTPEQFRVGVELIAKQMEEVLRALNVTPVETVGVPFDPRLHEALESVERADVPDHQVIDEVRRGYRIKDRLLRPALVRIASNPNQTEA
jgi:molecular chaperone GrpE